MRIDFSVRERLMRKSLNTLGLCFQCGTCTATCPLSGEASINYVRKLIKYAQYGVVPSDEKIIDFIWRCTTCGSCASSCPRGVDIPSIIRGYREILQEKRKTDPKITETLWRLYEARNPWGYSSSDLKKFRLNLKELTQSIQKPDYLLFACCSSVIDPISQRIIKSVSTILRSLGYKVSVLDPMCCGHVIYDSGETAFLEEYLSTISDVLLKLEAPLVVHSPHTLYMMRKVYPEFGLKIPVEIYHHTQLIAELISSGKLKLKASGEIGLVTYHDPCYLSRYLRITEEPRHILENIPGAKYIEMEHNREYTLCCGAGGGRIFSEEKGVRMATYRLKEANDSNAKILSTACQFCLRMFIDEAKIFKTNIVEIVDVSDLVARLI
jgi:Fe-S oxidoreductase